MNVYKWFFREGPLEVDELSRVYRYDRRMHNVRTTISWVVGLFLLGWCLMIPFNVEPSWVQFAILAPTCIALLTIATVRQCRGTRARLAVEKRLDRYGSWRGRW